MAELGPNDLLLQVTNALTLAEQLLELQLQQPEGTSTSRGGALLLKCELEHVVRHARQVAGLNPDGSFDQVPAPAKSKRGGR